jgi:hypothetical protein
MITVSNPHAMSSAKLTNQARFRFAGQKEYEQYLAKMRQFGPDTFKRIGDIAYVSHNQGPKHITLAKQYAKVDPDVAYMNDEITRLIHGRSSNKTTNPEASAQSAEHLDDFRRAVATSLEERGYPEHGRALEETERNQLLHSLAGAIWNSIRSLWS